MQRTLLLLGTIVIISACDKEKHLKGGELTEQSATLEVVEKDKIELANPHQLRAIEIKDPELKTTTISLRAHLTLPTQKDQPFTVSVDEEAAKRYGKGEVKLLPSQLISIPEEIRPIAQFAVTSDPFDVTIHLTDEIEFDEVYTFALRLNPIEGAYMNTPNEVVVFTLLRREDKVQINKAVRLTREVYFALEKDFTHNGDFTMECLVNVEKFRDNDDQGEAQITTLMGIEGGTLLRFGDFGYGNKIQAPGYNVENFTFDTNTWYHIALTYNAKKQQTILYIDGKEYANYPKYCSLRGGDNWYIGRSYSNGRGLPGLLSEVRVWKTTRTQAEIQDNMMQVDPTNSDLLAYWKMDSAEETRVNDLTGNGHNLLLKVQLGNEKPKVNVVTIDPPLEGIEK